MQLILGFVFCWLVWYFIREDMKERAELAKKRKARGWDSGFWWFG